MTEFEGSPFAILLLAVSGPLFWGLYAEDAGYLIDGGSSEKVLIESLERKASGAVFADVRFEDGSTSTLKVKAKNRYPERLGVLFCKRGFVTKRRVQCDLYGQHNATFRELK